MSPILGIYASQMSGHLWPASSYESIATTTVGAGGVASVTFSSIPSTYTHLQVRILAKFEEPTVAVDSIRTRFNGDSGNNYARHRISGDGSTASSAAATTTSFVNAGDMSTNSSNSGIFGCAILDILDYANTDKYKTTRSLDGNDRNGAGTVGLRSGLWMNTSAITQISFAAVGGSDFTQYSSFALYGIKGVA